MKGVCVLFFVFLALVHYSEAACTPSSIFTTSGAVSCDSDPTLDIFVWEVSNPSGGPILVTVSIDSLYFDAINDFFYYESDESFGEFFVYNFQIFYEEITFTSYTSDIILLLQTYGDSSEMNVTFTLLDNPCTTSTNIEWTLGPNPYFEISCQGTSTGAVHSTWSITTSGTTKYQINSGDNNTLGFYDGSSKSAQRLYPTTLDHLGYSTGTQLFVTFDNVAGPQNFDITFEYIDLWGTGSTEPEYWLSQASFSCNGIEQLTTIISLYGTVDTPTVVPPISEGKLAVINFQVSNFGNNKTVLRVFSGLTNFDLVENNTSIVLPFSLFDYLTIQIDSSAANPSLSFQVSWQILSQSLNPCLSSTSLTVPQTSGWIGCRSYDYDIIPSITPHSGSWLIQSPPGTRIVIQFFFIRYFGSDTLTLYDGPTTSSEILKTINLSTAEEPRFIADIYAASNSVLVVYKHSSLTESVLWELAFDYETLVSPCDATAQLYRTAETGRIQCTTVAPNLNSIWYISPQNGPISISFDSVNFVPGETLEIIDYSSGQSLGILDSTFNKTGAFVNTASNYLEFNLVTPSSITKRSNPGSFQVSYTTPGDLCELNSAVYFETIAGDFSCYRIKPSVTSTITIVPNNGLLDFDFDYYLEGGNIVITDLHGNVFTNDYYDFGSFTSLDGGVIIHFQSGLTDSYDNGDYFDFQYFTQGSLCGTSNSDILTSAKGVFGCPDGTNNGVDSYWLITPNNGVIVMKFATLDLEDGFDYIEIWDGSNNSGDYLGAFSSIPANNTIIVYSGSAYVHLHTDVATTSNGFEMVYTSGVGNACLTTLPIQLSDPFGSFGCPDGLAADVKSYWYITVPESDGVVEARFTEFSLTYPNQICVEYPNFIGECYDANNIPDVIVSTTNEMTFYVYTDQQEPGGFYIEYTAVQNDPCKLNRTVTLTANSNSFGCVTGISEDITSGWLIAPDDENVVTLTFSEFNLDSDSHISVYNGNTSNPTTLLGTFTGASLPSVLVSTGPYMFVYLVAGDENAAQRFRATYTTSIGDPCASSLEETILTSSGTFGCQHGVLPSVHSSWLVAPQSNNIIEFTIEWATLCSQCRLTIYDGSSTSADVLFRGNQTTNVVLYTTHSVALVTVDTIPNSNSNGFLIYFVTAIPPSPSPNIILPSATSSPIPEGFSRSASPAPLSPTQSPFSQTPVFRTRTASVSRTNFPQASQQVSTRTATPEPPTESPSASMSTTPEPVFPSTTATHSRAPQFTIVPFSPSNFPTPVATVIPSRRVRDMYTVDIEFTCKTSAATCCNNFQTLWVDLSTTNYYDLVDINSCVETSSGNIEVSLDQYGSQFFSAEQILDDYWKKASCNGKPLTGDICNVSGRGLSTSLWDISSMVVDGIAGIPSPLPYYYYEEVIYIGGSSIVTLSLGLVAFVLVIIA